MDDRVFVGLVIAILAVLLYYQWTFVACLLAIFGTGAAVRRQKAVTDKQKFRKDLQTNIRGADECKSTRNIQTLEACRLHANDDENCTVERNEGQNDEKICHIKHDCQMEEKYSEATQKDDTKVAAIYSDTTNKAGIIFNEVDREDREEPKKDLQTNILIIGADKSIDNIKTSETGLLDANVDKNCTVDTIEEHSDKKRDYQIEETFSETTQRDGTNVAAIYSDTTNKAGIIIHEGDREDREVLIYIRLKICTTRKGATTYGTYPLSSMKRIIHNGQPSRNGVRKIYEGMILTSPFGSLVLKASL